MNLRDETDGWYLALQDGRVQCIQIDFRLGLLVSDAQDKAQVYVGTPCRLRGANIDVALDPGEPSSLAPVLPLFNASVTGIAIRKTGQLNVQFGTGHCL